MHRLRFLYIDDDTEDAEIFSEFIRREFPDVEIDYSPTGLRKLEKYTEYDAVIVDYFLGYTHGNGIQLAKKIHDYDWKIPIMVLTGQDEDVSQSMEVWDCCDYVTSKNFPQRTAGRFKALIRWISRLKS